MIHRLIAVDVESSPPLTIVCAYSPTESADKPKLVKDMFYTALRHLIDDKLKSHTFIILGDLNARVAKHRLTGGVGRFTLGLASTVAQYKLVATV